MNTSLENLELSPEVLEQAREVVRQQAFMNWQGAGAPPGDGLSFWLNAERQWIELCYVPSRAIEAAGCCGVTAVK